MSNKKGKNKHGNKPKTEPKVNDKKQAPAVVTDSKKGDEDVISNLIGGIKTAMKSDNTDQLMKKVEVLKKSDSKVSDKKKQDLIKNPCGLDIGTSRIVGIKKTADGNVSMKDELNAFLAVPHSSFAQEMLTKNKLNYIEAGEFIYVMGYDAQEFANIFNAEVRRPMAKGLLKWDEQEAISVIKKIIPVVLDRPELGDNLCFSIPAPQAGFESDLVFHEALLKKFLVGTGYNAKSITEGMAVVLSELAEDNYTGIGVSMGAGMCNVCFSFLSVPVMVFSIPKGGDYIDQSVGRVVNETSNRVRVIKEESLDLAAPPRNNMENAFTIFYEEILGNLFNNIAAVLSHSEKLPRLSRPVPIVFAGGTSLPHGFKGKAEKILKQVSMPLEISDVRLASDPLKATARGALVNAMAPN